MTFILTALDGRILLGPLLGEGGMGTVHRAWDTVLERAVAVKFVRSGNPREAERLLLEARLQARVEHPNVVRIHEVGLLGDRACIVMQLVEGGPLTQLAGQLALPQKVALMRQAALGLHAAHREGLVHRDVKPGNVLVARGENGEPTALVSDFGLARDAEAALSQSGLPPGTLDFMPPEVLTGSASDTHSDIYSLGATFYAVLTGRLPFRDTTGDRSASPQDPLTPLEGPGNQMLRRIMEEEPPALVSLAPGVPRDFAVIVAKAMEKEPRDRYPTAEAFAEDLARAERGEPILARPSGLVDRAVKQMRRNPLAARAAISAVAFLLIGVGTALWQSRQGGIRSLEAARLGALAESLDAALRMEHLAPAHSIQPTLDRIRREAGDLKSRAVQGGPAAFALGRALDLLGDRDAALDAYRRAWGSGFRTPQVAEALGLAGVRVFDQEVQRARASLAPEALKRRIAELDRAFAEPARAVLDQADPSGWRNHWARSILAAVDEDFEAARDWARRLQTRDPQRYEAWLLESELWQREGERQLRQGHPKEGLASLVEAQRCAERVLQWGRSDPKTYDLLAMAHSTRTLYVNYGGPEHARETESAWAWLAKAKAVSPGNQEVLVHRALVLLAKARNPQQGGLASVIPAVDEAIQDLTEARRTSPQAVYPLQKLTTALTVKTQVLKALGRPLEAALDAALATHRELAAMAPEDPSTHYLGLVLHYVEGAALYEQDKDCEPAVRAAIAAGREALAREPVTVSQANGVLAQALGLLGRATWRNGKDPRGDLKASLDHAETVLRGSPGNVEAIYAAAATHWIVAGQLMEMGEAPDATLQRGLAQVDQGLALNGAHQELVNLKAYLWSTEATWRALQGNDPTAAIEKARVWLASHPHAGPADAVRQDAESALALAEAGWQVEQGRNPARALSGIARVLAPLLQTSVEARQKQAQVHLIRGLWLRRGKGSPQAEAEAGLALLTRDLGGGFHEPAAYILLARLQTLKGDLQAAAQSLASARGLNTLVTRSPEYARAAKDLQGR